MLSLQECRNLPVSFCTGTLIIAKDKELNSKLGLCSVKRNKGRYNNVLIVNYSFCLTKSCDNSKTLPAVSTAIKTFPSLLVVFNISAKNWTRKKEQQTKLESK